MCKVKGCINERIYQDGLCLYHYKYGTDKPVKEEKPKPIAKESKKRAKENRIDRKQNKKIIAERPLCEMKLEGCTKYAQSVQHVKGRIGKRLTDEKHKIPACNNCNRRAEEKPNEARAKKVAKSRLSKN